MYCDKASLLNLCLKNRLSGWRGEGSWGRRPWGGEGMYLNINMANFY